MSTPPARDTAGLPSPDAAARAHGTRVLEHICQRIEAAGGWIPFALYMELALYAPGLGYYMAGLRKFGAAGDFVTAPELTPLFGAAVARQLAQIIELTDGDILELGAGSGVLAVDVLGELDRLGALPSRYSILEPSPELAQRQQRRLDDALPGLAKRVQWCDRLPARFSGAVIANEVLDALPVHVLAWREAGLFERGVGLDKAHPVWRERPAGAALRTAAEGLAVTAPYVSEISPAARALVRELGDCLEQGVVLMIDYGFPRAEYYHPQRTEGTLMCHYRHRVHDDPFFLPGLQDITSHVDFTAVAEAGVGTGSAVGGYTSLAHFLLNCGITGLLQRAQPEDTAAYLPQAALVQKLLSPAEMGELFKVLALTRGIEVPLLGFSPGDRVARL